MAGPETFDLLGQLLITEVLSRYDLGGPIDCTRIYSGLHEVYQVNTGAEPVMLKVYRAGWRTAEDDDAEIAVLRHLGSKGVAVSQPLADRDGAWVHTLSLPEGLKQPAGVRHAILFTYARGKAVRFQDEASCRLFGRTLAEMHNATDDLADGRIRFDLEYLLEAVMRRVSPLLEDRPEERDFLQRLAVRLRERIAALPPEALDWGFCHGDYSYRNGHLDDSTGVITLFDFEGGGTGFRTYDLAVFQTIVEKTCSELLWNKPAEENWGALWQAFLSGYAERRPLNVIDREALPLFVPLRPIQILGNMVKSSQTGQIARQGFFENMLQFLREWERIRL